MSGRGVKRERAPGGVGAGLLEEELRPDGIEGFTVEDASLAVLTGLRK